MDVDVEAWFDGASETVRVRLAELRDLILEAVPEVREEIKWGRPCYSVGGVLFCYLQASRAHATLGFQQGAALADPGGLLEGAGKEMRHVKVVPGRATQTQEILALLREAADRALR
jgi:hypothetical protein